MIKKFKTLFFVKSSLISLYLAFTIPIPLISIEGLKIISIILFFLGLFLIINITSDYVETSKEKVSYKTTHGDKKFLVPQRVENLEEFLSLIHKGTGLKTEDMSYISPIWTYKLLTLLSVFMIIGEIITFSI